MTPCPFVRRSLLTLLLWSLSVASSAAAITPTRLIVTVTDPSGLVLPDAIVTIAESAQDAPTDRLGVATFTNVTPGTVTLVVSRAGFEPLTCHGIAIRAGHANAARVSFTAVRSRPTQVDVVGEQEAAIRLVPGSVGLVSSRDLAAAHALDANEILRRVPGLVVREDSGPVGTRLNVGIRGLNPDRSRQVLVLEDGLPLALAPYGEPEMYYSPPVERMERIEIVKGSGAILYGPQTIGGVINFVTPDPPQRPRGLLTLTAGERALFIGQAGAGGSVGRLGLFASGLRKQGDGFRRTGFDITDGTLKASWTVRPGHTIGAKVNGYDERSNSTYLGLTRPQYDADPDHNTVPHDRLDVSRVFASVHARSVLSPRSLLTTTAFAYRTSRLWRRQDFDRRPMTGRTYVAVDGNPEIPGGAIFLRASSGSRDRAFIVAGAETRLLSEGVWAGHTHGVETGARILYERATDEYVQWSAVTGGTPTLRDAEQRPGLGLSAFVQDRVSLAPSITLTPGLRVEHYRYWRHITRARVGGTPTNVGIRGGDEVTRLLPGIGLAWQATERTSLFTGAHRGFAPPRVKDAIRGDGTSVQLDAELSWNYEAGLRWHPRGGLRVETTAFLLDFSNQIIPAAASGGATTTLINAGRTQHRGIEVSAGFDAGFIHRLPRGLFAEVRYAWVPTAHFVEGLYAGRRLPYAPESAGQALVGWRSADGWSVQADLAVTGSQFADNLETVTETADGTVGRLPAITVWNFAVERRMVWGRFQLSPFVAVKNPGNRIYIASRAPEGIQPGPFRQVTVGLRTSY